MTDNYPPGVTESMIPGNRPLDNYHDCIMGKLNFDLYKLPQDEIISVCERINDGFAHSLSVPYMADTLNDWYISRYEREPDDTP